MYILYIMRLCTRIFSKKLTHYETVFLSFLPVRLSARLCYKKLTKT